MPSTPAPFATMKKGFDYGQAVAEANRCLLCYDAPCSKGCPGGTDPGTFIRKLRFQNITGAIRTIKQNNILGGSCGELCPTPQLCEKQCAAAGLDRPIQIGKIQRFLVEHSWQIGFNPLEKGPARKEKIAVVGSGPAGLSCAAELAKAGVQVTVFEARAKAGGVLRYGVPSYRFSPDFLDRELQDLTSLGVTLQCSAPIRGKGAVEALLQQGFAAVFLAPGCWEPMRLKAKTPVQHGLLTWTEFLSPLKEGKVAEIGKHVKGRRVAVIGGGSVAIDCAESAIKLGAKDVFLLYRRSYTEMPAQEDEKTSALQSGMHLLLLNQPVDYVTDAKGRLTAVKLIRTELGEPDASGRRRPVEVPGSNWDLKVDVVIEAIGAQPVRDSIEWSPAMKLTDGNLISVNPDTGETSIQQVFAGGDIVRGPALIIEAVKDGKTAAKAIIERLAKQEKSHA
jgi:glutamate synthase (NADPH/NADH) small chain